MARYMYETGVFLLRQYCRQFPSSRRIFPRPLLGHHLVKATVE